MESIRLLLVMQHSIMHPKRSIKNEKEGPNLGESPIRAFVCVLTIESINHGCNYQLETEIISVYNSKAVAGSVNSGWGTFDRVIVDMLTDPGEHIIDNRGNVPDQGVLLQLGDDDVGEGNIARLVISKMPIMGMTESSSDANDDKRKRARK
mmetsp:Transcript_919/g.1711  ORF Transcript_919/g.1711 Transcript_919/m.1711 type:complete len:151 (-) Transcript_919:173-625(-)